MPARHDVIDVVADLDIGEQPLGQVDVPGRLVELGGDDIVEVEVLGVLAAGPGHGAPHRPLHDHRGF